MRYEVAARIATLTLDRPERLNAISPQMDAEIVEALERAEADAGVHAAIIQGAGRAFSAGADSKRDDASGMPVPTSPTDDRDGRELALRRSLRVWDLRIPVIAKVHGYCFGRATQLVIVCDLAFVAEDTQVGPPRIPLGAGFNSSFWAWEIGPKRTKEIFLAGRTLSGTEAAALGIFNAALPADALDEHVAAYAAKLARTPRELLTLQKRAINRTQDLRGFREALAQSVEVNIVAHNSDAVREINREIRERGLRGAIAWYHGDERGGER